MAAAPGRRGGGGGGLGEGGGGAARRPNAMPPPSNEAGAICAQTRAQTLYGGGYIHRVPIKDAADDGKKKADCFACSREWVLSGAAKMSDDSSARRLLASCSTDAIDTLRFRLDVAMSDRRAMQRTLDESSAQDLARLRGMYVRTLGVGVATSAASILILPRRTRPIAKLAAGTVAAALGGAVYASASMRTVAEAMITQPLPSALADQILCPALARLQPCVDDPRCRELMQKGAAGGSVMAKLCEECRQVSQVSHVHTHSQTWTPLPPPSDHAAFFLLSNFSCIRPFPHAQESGAGAGLGGDKRGLSLLQPSDGGADGRWGGVSWRGVSWRGGSRRGKVVCT